MEKTAWSVHILAFINFLSPYSFDIQIKWLTLHFDYKLFIYEKSFITNTFGFVHSAFAGSDNVLKEKSW